MRLSQRIAFGAFSASLIVAAITFNLEKILISIIFFVIALICGTVLVHLNRSKEKKVKMNK
ncbi:MAG: hypothetical protein J6Y08_01155 [Clostridiales bacterium]|nr:hypothetical protein [Clostridiales bacterium]